MRKDNKDVNKKHIHQSVSIRDTIFEGGAYIVESSSESKCRPIALINLNNEEGVDLSIYNSKFIGAEDITHIHKVKGKITDYKCIGTSFKGGILIKSDTFSKDATIMHTGCIEEKIDRTHLPRENERVQHRIGNIIL